VSRNSGHEEGSIQAGGHEKSEPKRRQIPDVQRTRSSEGFIVGVNQRTRPAISRPQSFEEFFRDQYDPLFRLMYALTGVRAEAEDLSQEAMARVFERWDRVATMTAPDGYAYRIALNLNRRRLRHLAVRARRLLLLPTPEPVQPDVHGEIMLALASLPVGQREALLLTEWVGLDAAEAGELIGISAASVRSRVHRAKTALRPHSEVDEGA
jgi:RNA polymerase sigma factor (sigma-70 family)